MKAAVTAALMLGTIPAVGGYSNTTPQAGGDSQTVGIVTQVEGGAFSVEAADKAAALPLAAGHGVLTGHKMWVEPGSLVRITDTRGGRLTVAGPATLEFFKRGRLQDTVRIFRGSVKFHSGEGETMHFESAFADGAVSGEGAVWASSELVQVVGLAGDVKAWHPHLASAQVLVTPGFFSESSTRFNHLQPKKPARVDEEHFEKFLARFDEPVALEKRELASDEKPVKGEDADDEEEAKVGWRGTRSAAELAEQRDPAALRYLKAHTQGFGVDPKEEGAPLAPTKPRFDVWGQPIKAGRVAGRRTQEQ